MRPGAAQPFLQPWYVPISCNARDTGMPMGGIGNAFTLTPAGTTPVLSWLDGIHVTGPVDAPIRLQNIFFAERRVDAPLEVIDAGAILRFNDYQPLLRQDGRRWLSGRETPAEVKSTVTQMAAEPGLYRDNSAALRRWQVTLSPRTLALSKKRHTAELSRALLLDIFGGSLSLQAKFSGALTGDVEEQKIDGQKAYSADSMAYVGLYPLAETVYRNPGHDLILTRRNFSPVICGDERACSLPVSITEIEFENPTAQPLEATVVWTLENLCGDLVVKERPGVQDAWFRVVRTARYQIGEAIHDRLPQDGRTILGFAHTLENPDVDSDFSGGMALAMECESPDSDFYATAHPTFYVADAERITREALDTGRIAPPPAEMLATGRERRMGALCATVVVPAGGRRKVRFALALDFPNIKMRGFSSRKKYTEFFPQDPGRAALLALETLRRGDDYLARILKDHAGMDETGPLADFLKTAPSAEAANRFQTLLANSLGFLADATVWDNQEHFWVRECADYPFFNSLDVYFYGSFSVLRLLPRMDGSVLREFARAVLQEDPTVRRHWIYSHQPFADLPDPRHQGPRGVTGAVPHDMGSPFDPKPDAYIWHNVKHWKDLAPKFLLLVWRHYKLTGDKAFLSDCREAAFAALKYLSDMREPGETIPLTHGTDDTFDNLASHGISIYCGSLWVAALSAGAAIAEALGEKDKAEDWQALGALAQRDLTQTLWDEKTGGYLFYKIPGSGAVSDDVFADQLLSDLWLELLGLPEITPKNKRLRVARRILDNNFHINSPGVGAANLCAADGKALDSFQAQDVWVGVQFSLAAAAARAGEIAGAWELIEAQYENLYNQAKIPFGAPEGFNASVPGSEVLQYTAGRYLRPGMAWVFAWGVSA